MFHRRLARAAALTIGLAGSPVYADALPVPAAAPFSPGWVEATLRSEPDAFGRVLENAEALRAQVVIGVLERTGEGAGARWVLRQDAWRADAEYFYPASAIKLPAAVAALAEAAVLAKSRAGFDRNSPLKFHTLPGISRAAASDPTAPDGHLTLAWEVRKALVISDNHAYSRLFEFAGHRAANERMWRAGLRSVRFWHRLNVVRTLAENRRSPRIDFFEPVPGSRQPARRRPVALLPQRQSDLLLSPPEVPGLDVGKAYLDPADGRTRIERPMSFREKNAVSLVDLQRLLAVVVRPEADLGEALRVDVEALGLTESDRTFLVGALGEDPARLAPAVWKGPDYEEQDYRPALAGVLKVRPRSALEVRGKAGRAYGFHVENAFFFDERSRRGLFLAAVIHVDTDGLLNDGRYEYATLSTPFMADLGRVFARAVFDAADAARGP